MSMGEQARAAEATRNRIRELNNEMGKFTLAQRVASGGRTIASIGAGVAAGGYVLSKPIEQTMDYGMRLAQMSNTAFTDRDTKGRIAGKRELNDAVVKSVRYGGGTREGAAETLDSIIASGAVSGKDAMAMLPTLMKAATASGAQSTELAQIGIRAMQTFKIKPEDLSSITDMGIAAGQAGGFELKDMAKWLPQQMAMATNLGMSGKAGFAKLAAWNQASVITSGTKDEAGNNLRDLLMEINTPHFARHLQQIGVDGRGTLLKAQGKGINNVDATVTMVEKIVEKDKSYQALQAKLKGASNDGKKQIYEAMSKQMEGTAVGKIFHNQQSLMGFLGLMNNKEYVADVEKKTHEGEGNAGQKNFEVMSAEPEFKVQQAKNEKVFATYEAFDKLTPLIGSVADGFKSVAQEYPIMTSATIAATTALTALAAAAGAAGLVNMMMAGKGGGLTEMLSKGKGFASGAGSFLMKGARALTLPGLIGTGLYEGGSAALNAYQGKDASNMLSPTRGSLLSDVIGEAVARSMALFGNQSAKDAIQINVHLDGEQIATVVNKRNSRLASRN